MANYVTYQFNNSIEDIATLRQYLEARIQYIRRTRGVHSWIEREVQDILDMLPVQ